MVSFVKADVKVIDSTTYLLVDDDESLALLVIEPYGVSARPCRHRGRSCGRIRALL